MPTASRPTMLNYTHVCRVALTARDVTLPGLPHLGSGVRSAQGRDAFGHERLCSGVGGGIRENATEHVGVGNGTDL